MIFKEKKKRGIFLSTFKGIFVVKFEVINEFIILYDQASIYREEKNLVDLYIMLLRFSRYGKKKKIVELDVYSFVQTLVLFC